jgi:glutamate synthase domain-containing protein 3
MSGGIAYIYDEKGELSKRINTEMVDLDKIETEEDSQEVVDMIVEYIQYTGSTEARAILDDWENSQSKFIKVMPRDYKRVLKNQAEEK